MEGTGAIPEGDTRGAATADTPAVIRDAVTVMTVPPINQGAENGSQGS